MSTQPPSRTRFYRDTVNGKVMGVCAGIADYTGMDVTHGLDYVDDEDKRFWQGVRASPTRSARDIRSRMRDIDRRLADIESYVTTENRCLASEIDRLR